jgi:hypothetical protein
MYLTTASPNASFQLHKKLTERLRKEARHKIVTSWADKEKRPSFYPQSKGIKVPLVQKAATHRRTCTRPDTCQGRSRARPRRRNRPRPRPSGGRSWRSQHRRTRCQPRSPSRAGSRGSCPGRTLGCCSTCTRVRLKVNRSFQVNQRFRQRMEQMSGLAALF